MTRSMAAFWPPGRGEASAAYTARRRFARRKHSSIVATAHGTGKADDLLQS
ncbi:hypothetical protein ABIE45_005415 [Methylobacterium sp. OAE515]|uniref:hypothetical protein n=1 Tax=Methylobacterium sp. OAE515 TaxID=2817895 RepID=UPI00178BE6C5